MWSDVITSPSGSNLVLYALTQRSMSLRTSPLTFNMGKMSNTSEVTGYCMEFMKTPCIGLKLLGSCISLAVQTFWSKGFVAWWCSDEISVKRKTLLRSLKQMELYPPAVTLTLTSLPGGIPHTGNSLTPPEMDQIKSTSPQLFVLRLQPISQEYIGDKTLAMDAKINIFLESGTSLTPQRFKWSCVDSERLF